MPDNVTPSASAQGRTTVNSIKTCASIIVASAVCLVAGCTPKTSDVQKPVESAAPPAAAAAAPTSAAPAQPASLEGTSWVLASLPGKTLANGSPATITFAQGRASGSDGCNRFTMGFTTSGSQIQFPTQPAGTLMACPPGVQEQAQWFIQAVTAAQTWQVADGQLTLLDANGKTLATFVEQRQELAGTAWNATGINNGREALVSLVTGSTVTLNFGTDGTVFGSSGCNSFNAGFAQTGGSVTFKQPASTRKMCPDAAVMEQEKAFLNALVASTAVQLEGGQLVFRDAGGAMQVTAAKQ
jgi:heat shock protein HslJ